MVKVVASTFSALLLTISAVMAQINVADYPTINEVPPVTSAQVQAWLKEVDLSGAPNIPVLTAPKGSPPACVVPAVANSCVWTCDNCPSDDITSCAVPNTWGLTFDDGPSTATPTLLDFLKTNKLSASFFLIGSNVIQYPDTVKREVTEGHHLASHTWSHTALTTLTNEQIVAEMKWTEKAVMAATGLRLKYMRPPYGDINNRVRYVLKQLGYTPVDWTGDAFDTNDWRIGSSGFTEAQAVSVFSKSLDTYVNSTKASGFYCLEHDVSATTVSAALKLIPQGISRKINFANVATCQSDASPYQSGSNTIATTTSGSSTASSTKTSGGTATSTSSTGSGSSGNNTSSGPKVVSAAGSQVASIGVVSAIAAAAAALLA
ncbi:chitin deacetylase [Entomortierella chlamydospora]|nr:chitin deacetylase [Entomortierella chlamydospora]